MRLGFIGSFGPHTREREQRSSFDSSLPGLISISFHSRASVRLSSLRLCIVCIGRHAECPSLQYLPLLLCNHFTLLYSFRWSVCFLLGHTPLISYAPAHSRARLSAHLSARLSAHFSARLSALLSARLSAHLCSFLLRPAVVRRPVLAQGSWLRTHRHKWRQV